MNSRKDSLFLPRSLSRRTALKGLGATALATGIPFTRLSMASAQEEEIPTGGVLKVGIIGEPPTVMDAQSSTATITGHIARHVFQSLFAADASLSPQPMLLEDYTLSDDELTYTFHLRDGITFHNGDPLTADDVVASLNRWGLVSGRGRHAFGRMNSLDKVDDLTVEMSFNAPTGIVLTDLASVSSMIMPASIAEATGEDTLTEFIGTGPFKFEEHAPDQYLRLVRFDDYVPRDEEPDGEAGRRVAYVDQIDFIPVPDESVRANGVISGEYHFAEAIPPDYLDTMELDPNVVSYVVKPNYHYGFHLNKQKGLFSDVRARHAIQLCFSQSEALKAGFGRDELIRADASLAGEETAWYSVVGAENYDNPDPERARALLDEVGYDGEPVRWLTTHEYPYYFRIGDYVQQYAEEIGLNIELVVSDWATVVQNRADPDANEIFSTGHPQFTHPATAAFNDEKWPGFWVSEAKDEAVKAMVEAADADALSSAVDHYTEVFWEEMPYIKVGDNFGFRASGANVVGYQNGPEIYFWNVGIS